MDTRRNAIMAVTARLAWQQLETQRTQALLKGAPSRMGGRSVVRNPGRFTRRRGDAERRRGGGHLLALSAPPRLRVNAVSRCPGRSRNVSTAPEGTEVT